MTGDIDEIYIPGVLRRREPASNGAPLVFDIPRSGAEYPRDFRSPASFNDVKSSISTYVEELFSAAPDLGAGWLYACFPNAYIDANRNENDIDPDLIEGAGPGDFAPTQKSSLGVGLIHSVTDAGGMPLQEVPISRADLARRLDHFYWPYHNTLSDMLQAHREAAGMAFHVSCHSMASVARKVSVDAGAQRSDFDIGDGNGVTCERGFVDAVVECLSGLGYRVTVNKHFAGAECIHKHGDPQTACHSLQIETRRGLYMDEETYAKKPDFAKIQGDIGTLIGALTEYASTRSR